MDNRIKQYLFDIEECISNIESFTNSITSFVEFENNFLVRRAVEREITIIGEAMNRILKIDAKITITNSRKIVDTRNKMIHGYDEVDPGVIYAIIKKNLPLLKKEIKRL